MHLASEERMRYQRLLSVSEVTVVVGLWSVQCSCCSWDFIAPICVYVCLLGPTTDCKSLPALILRVCVITTRGLNT